MNTVLTVLLLVIGLFDCFLWWYCLVFLRRKAKELERFVSPKTDGETSPAADVFDVCAKRLIKLAMIELKTSAMGNSSVDSRKEMAIVSAVNEDKVNLSNPALGAVLDMLPALKKKVLKNPSLVDMALSYLASKGRASSPNSNHSSDTKTHIEI